MRASLMFFGFIGVLAFMALSGIAQAAEPVQLKTETTSPVEQRILDMAKSRLPLKSGAEAVLGFSAKDLNDDGINEYIITENCSYGTPKPCDTWVVANNNGNLSILAQFTAKNIALSNKYTNGIRDLLVYNDPGNDFRYTIFRWNSPRGAYQGGEAEEDVDADKN